jgi:TolB-like protein/DNA-binding SARP family transcriptional activator/Flp pilus assembly protein TadD
MLRLHTFGGCFLARDGARLDALSGQRKGLALLALLAAAGERGVGREALLVYLWPASDQERARTSLKQLVHSLRQQVQAPDFLLTAGELRLSPAHITSDVAEFRDARQRGDHEAAVRLYAGPFLDGFYLKGADDLERWAATERATLAHGFARALEALAEGATARGDARVAVEWWRRFAHAEPLSARGAAGLMRALDAAGERAAALQHARVYEHLMREELGSAPDPAVTDLVACLQRARSAPAPALPAEVAPVDDAPAPMHIESDSAVATPGTAPRAESVRQVTPRRPRWRVAPAAAAWGAALLLSGVAAHAAWSERRDPLPPTARPAAVATPSVAVLPFTNTSGDPADEHSSDGLTDELIGALGKVSGLTVAGRTSAFALKGSRLGVRAVAETLGVSFVVEGSWRRSGGRLRVGAQLVSAADGAVLWAETYDRGVADIFAVQEEIARAIVGALQVRLGAGGARAHLVERPTADLAAYELYLKGRHVYEVRTGREGILQAVGYFEQATARDPAYAHAYAGLSDAYTRLAILGYGPPRETFTRAKAAVHRALALDSTLAAAHASLGHVLFVSEFARADAERHFRRAIALDPSYPLARAWLGVCLSDQGRFAEAIAQLDTARALDPLSSTVGHLLGRIYVRARRPDDAIRTLAPVLDLYPQSDLAHQQLGHAYLLKGMGPQALTALRRAAALTGPRDSAQLAYALAVTGDAAEAEQILRALLAPARRGGGALPYHIAMAYAGLGDRDAAFGWLDRGYAERASFMAGVKVDPGFARLHADPRWPGLLRRMALAP